MNDIIRDNEIQNGGVFARFQRAISIHMEGESHVFVILGASVSGSSQVCRFYDLV